MSWPYIWVRLRHKPSGLTAEANCLRSQYRMCCQCVAMIRGKWWSITRGGYMAVKDRPVRTYSDSDFDRRDIVEISRTQKK